MFRRIGLFLLAFGTGLGILVLVIGRDKLLPAADAQEVSDQKTVSVPAGGVRIGPGTGGGVQGVPNGATIAFEGSGEISPLQDEVRIGDRVWQAPEFKLAWSDSQPVGSGRYRLLGVRFTTYAKLTAMTVNPAIRETMRVDADSMELVLAQKGDELAIDSQHDIAMRRVRVTAPRETLGKAFASSIKLESDRMRARIHGETAELETPEDEPFVLRTLPEAGEVMQYVLRGRGLTVELDTVQKDGEQIRSVGSSRLHVASQVDLRGTPVASAAGPGAGRQAKFRLRSAGPLECRAYGASLLRVSVEDDVRFEGRSASAESARPFEAYGKRALVWLRRSAEQAASEQGSEQGKASASAAMSLAVTDIMVYGASDGDGSAPARMLFGGQSVHARSFEVNLDPWQQPERLTARGAPRLRLFDSKGRAMGRVDSEARMIWERPGVSLDTCLRVLGIDFGQSILALRAFMPSFPREILRFEGPAVYVPAKAQSAITSAKCSDGALVTLTESLGSLEPNLLLGHGDAKITGALRDGGSFTAVGNRGFVLQHTPGAPEVHASLGPITADPEHEFRFEGGEDVVRGHGLVSLSFAAREVSAEELSTNELEKTPESKAAQRARLDAVRSGALEFVAALRRELHWERRGQSEDLDVTGVKYLRLAQSKGEDGTRARREVRATGLPMRFASSTGIVARASVAERVGDAAWVFRSGSELVRCDVEAREGRSPGTLFARVVRVGLEPSLVPAKTPVPQVRLFAKGEVRLETSSPERGLDLVLTCDELERFPQPARPLLIGAAIEALGDAGRLLAPVIWGGETGLLHARGRVSVRAKERQANGRIARRDFDGDSLWIDADRGLGRFVLEAVAPRRSVTARLSEPGRGIVELEASRIAGREGEFVLASFRTPPPSSQDLIASELKASDLEASDLEVSDLIAMGTPQELSPSAVLRQSPVQCVVRLIEEGGKADARRLLLRSSATIRFAGDVLRVPGPVLAQMVDAEDRYREGDFELMAEGDAIVRLRREARQANASGFEISMPKSVASCTASGGVRMRWGQVLALGDRLEFTPDDAWLVLQDSRDDVTVTIADTTRVRASPELAFNVRTHDYRGMRLRVEGSVGSR